MEGRAAAHTRGWKTREQWMGMEGERTSTYLLYSSSWPAGAGTTAVRRGGDDSCGGSGSDEVAGDGGRGGEDGGRSRDGAPTRARGGGESVRDERRWVLSP